MKLSAIMTVNLNPAIDRGIEVPNFRIGSHLKARLLNREPAGKAFNVSRVLARLGHRSRVTGFLGESEKSLFESFAAEVSSGLIDCDFVLVPGRTRENLTLNDPVNQTQTHLREAGFEVSEEQIVKLENQLLKTANPEQLIVFAGSLPPGLSANRWGVMLDRCLGAGSPVAVDTSGEALREALNRPLWLAKPNLDEFLDAMMPAPDQSSHLTATTVVHELASVLSGKIKNLLISHGRDGAYLYAENRIWHGEQRIPDQQVANTVGCGDSLVAGFIAGMVEQQTAENALRFSIAAATANLKQSNKLNFTRAEVEQINDEVELANVENSDRHA